MASRMRLSSTHMDTLQTAFTKGQANNEKAPKGSRGGHKEAPYGPRDSPKGESMQNPKRASAGCQTAITTPPRGPQKAPRRPRDTSGQLYRGPQPHKGGPLVAT